MKAIMRTAKQNTDVMKTLKSHIERGIQAEQTEDKSLELQIHNVVSEENIERFDEKRANELMTEKQERKRGRKQRFLSEDRLYSYLHRKNN